MKAKYYYIMFISLATIEMGCDSQDQLSSDIQKLALEECRLKMELSHLHDSIRGTWNHVNDVMASALPEDMPDEEKSNMLKVRNAELIRMFETYDGLADSIKSSVDEAELVDSKIAKKVIDLRHRLGLNDEERVKLFTAAREKGELQLAEVEEQYRTISTNCKNELSSEL